MVCNVKESPQNTIRNNSGSPKLATKVMMLSSSKQNITKTKHNPPHETKTLLHPCYLQVMAAIQ